MKWEKFYFLDESEFDIFNFLKYQIKNGIAVRDVKKFEIGWQISIPFNWKNFVRIKINGIKNIPCLQLAKKIPCLFCPVLWKSIFVIIAIGKNGKDKAKYLTASEPIFTTSTFDWKIFIMEVEKTKSKTAKQVSIIKLKNKVNLKDDFNRPKFFAPKENPATVWKPCPKPNITETTKRKILEEIVIPASAESPKNLAWLFNKTFATITKPCRKSVALPVTTIEIIHVENFFTNKEIFIFAKFFWDKYKINKTIKLTIWLIKVASPEPEIPNLK